MKLQEAIKTMEAAGFTFVKKERCIYAEVMDYYFTRPDGKTQSWTLGGLRKRAEREQWKAWMKAQEAELKRGIQMELF